MLVSSWSRRPSSTVSSDLPLARLHRYYWNQSYSRCVPWYSEQEIYQQNQDATVRGLESSSRGGAIAAPLNRPRLSATRSLTTRQPVRRHAARSEHLQR